MKFLTMLLMCSLCLFAQPVFIIKSLEGKQILTTQDTTLLSKLTNVVIDTICPSPTVYKISIDSSDSLRARIISTLSKPTQAVYYYDLTWKVDSVYITLIKTRNSAVITCNSHGNSWIISHFPDLKK